MEQRFAYDFSRVRVHTGERAAESVRAVDAHAYTVGNDVVFDTGRYRPWTDEGRRLLSHELVHVAQHAGTAASDDLPIGLPGDTAEREADTLASEASGEIRGALRSPVLRRLGVNPGCTPIEASAVHQAIFDARGWLDKARPQLEGTPLAPAVLGSLRRNFGPTYGVAANAALIASRLGVARRALSTIAIGCAGVADATCAAGHCGHAAAGSHAATICSNVTLVAGADSVYRAGCVLHESLHASFSGFTVDEYSGWHGHSGSTATYPGVGTDPLLNADSYTSLVMDLS